MQYYIHHNNQQLGPFTEAEVKAQLASGAITSTDHVWWQGQQGWVPLNQTALAGTPVPGAPVTPVIPGTAAAAAYPPGGVIAPTSKLAIWALVCGCLSLLCGLFASIPAIILGHLGLNEVKRTPGLQGRGMALAGMILGYVFTALIVLYLILFFFVFASMSKDVRTTFDTINAQLKAAEATNNAGGMATSPDQSTNSSDQSTTNSPDQSTNSADMSTNSPGTNAPDTSTNAPPTNQ